MVDEVVDLLRPVPAGLIVDATVGAGGHSAAILTELPQVSVLGVDRDEDALEAAAATLAPFGERVTLRRIRFDALAATMEELDVDRIAGALFDLGVSSPQFDRADRGFSYRYEGPLDMRMDRSQDRTAADIVNGEDEASLARLLRGVRGRAVRTPHSRTRSSRPGLCTRRPSSLPSYATRSRHPPAGGAATPRGGRSKRCASR